MPFQDPDIEMAESSDIGEECVMSDSGVASYWQNLRSRIDSIINSLKNKVEGVQEVLSEAGIYFDDFVEGNQINENFYK